MKETLKLEDPKRLSHEFFDFHDKVNKVLEVNNPYVNWYLYYFKIKDQEEIFAIHMAVIKVIIDIGIYNI